MTEQEQAEKQQQPLVMQNRYQVMTTKISEAQPETLVMIDLQTGDSWFLVATQYWNGQPTWQRMQRY